MVVYTGFGFLDAGPLASSTPSVRCCGTPGMPLIFKPTAPALTRTEAPLPDSQEGRAGLDVSVIAIAPPPLPTGNAKLLTGCSLKFGPKRAADERWRVQSTHQHGTCRVWTGRDGELGVSHEHILIFRFMCADHAARYSKSAGKNPERSGTPGMEKFLAKMEKV